jgi:hypothetical protein
MRFGPAIVVSIALLAPPAFAQSTAPSHAPSAQPAAPPAQAPAGAPPQRNHDEVAVPHDKVQLVTPNHEFLWASSIALGTAYGLSVIIATASSNSTDNYLYIPLAGPWVDLALRHCSEPTGVQCTDATLHGVGLFFDGLVQAAGLAGIIVAFLVPEARWVPQARPAIFPNGGRGIVLTLYGDEVPLTRVFDR